MSDFSVKVQKIFIKPHPNADALELGNIGHKEGWQVCVKKGQFRTGDLVVYIGENSVVPDWILKRYGFWNEEKDKGLLAGTKGNRVKAIRLRNEFSLGICLPTSNRPEPAYTISMIELENESKVIVDEGTEVAEILGVIKYEPPIPTQLAGEVFFAGMSIGVSYDVEDIKNYPDVLEDGEEVQMSVKIHGTNVQIVWLCPHEMHLGVNIDEWIKVFGDANEFYGYIAIASKGLGAKGMFFKDNEANKNNVYLRAVRPHLEVIAKHWCSSYEKCVTIVGEVFGSGIQDFNYGLTNDIAIRGFDIYLGFRGQGFYLDDEDLDNFLRFIGLDRAPVVYRGPFSYKKLDELANAPETEFNCKHIREGVVVKPIKEKRHPALGRIALKHRSEAYMSRKNGTEFN